MTEAAHVCHCQVEDERLRVHGLAVSYLSVGTKGPGQSSAIVYAAVALRVSGLGWRKSASALYLRGGHSDTKSRTGMSRAPCWLCPFSGSVTVVPS